jgi:hypothetical protein
LHLLSIAVFLNISFWREEMTEKGELARVGTHTGVAEPPVSTAALLFRNLY